MAYRRLSVRKVHLVLRLFFGAGLGVRAIARSVQASPSTVGDYLRRLSLSTAVEGDRRRSGHIG
jgi:hypothetical protein